MKKLALTAALVALVAAPAAAQNWRLDPSYGATALTSGFQPDPHTQDIQAGGSINAGQSIGQQCPGFVADAPDYRINFTAGNNNLPLIFFVRSSSDTTLVINAPDGRWYCNDDSHGTLNPSVRFDNPQAGQYDVWIGTFEAGSLQPSRLFVTEIDGLDQRQQ